LGLTQIGVEDDPNLTLHAESGQTSALIHRNNVAPTARLRPPMHWRIGSPDPL